MKVATTIALSKLVGEGGVNEPVYLRSALDAISEYARLDTKGADPEFTEQVTQLVVRLNTILEDSAKIRKHQQNGDTEMLADLYHHIAQSYTNAPALRVTWLESLAKLHESNKYYNSSSFSVVFFRNPYTSCSFFVFVFCLSFNTILVCLSLSFCVCACVERGQKRVSLLSILQH
jgi:hypothetical protein